MFSDDTISLPALSYASAMSVQTFVTVHDQDLVLESEASGQFAALTNVVYLFVGPRPVDRIPAGVEMIVARDYTPNHEDLPQFYDFTGWSVLTRHNLIDADHMICLQYDMAVTDPQIENRCTQLLDQAPGMVAFTAGHKGPNWMLHIPGFEQAFRQGLAAKSIDFDQLPDFGPFPSTQGTAWRRDTLTEYMEWFDPLFTVFAPEVFAGHLAERTVKVFSTLTYPEQYLTGVISHAAADCHGTGALMCGNRSLYEARNASFMNQSS